MRWLLKKTTGKVRWFFSFEPMPPADYCLNISAKKSFIACQERRSARSL
jgi:hypothetical protein